MPEINEALAHITHSDGAVFQVLNEAGDDWDEPATRAEYERYIAHT